MKKSFYLLIIFFLSISIIAQNQVWQKDDRQNVMDESIYLLSKYDNIPRDKKELIGKCCLDIITSTYKVDQYKSLIDYEIKTLQKTTISKCAKDLGFDLDETLLTVQVQLHGLYIGAGGGYGLSAAPSLNYSETITISDGTTSTSEYKIIKGSGSLGKGIQVGGLIGYMFNKNLGAELDISYLIGKECSNWIKNYYSTATSKKAKILRLIPALKIALGKGNLKPYLRTGLVIGMAGTLNEITNISYFVSGIPNVEERERDYSGRLSLGFAGAIGSDYKLSEIIGIFAEMSIITHSWAPKKSIYTKYIINGVDHLSSMTTNSKETEYVDSYFDWDTDPSSPKKQLKFHEPLSSVGINVGVRVFFGK